MTWANQRVPVRRRHQEPAEPLNGLAKLSHAAELLAEVRSATDAKHVMDVAAAAEHYARKARLGQDAIDSARAIMVDAQRILGEFLQSTPKNAGANGSRVTGSKREPVKDPRPTLADIGIPKKLSSDSQALAEIANTKPELYAEVRSGVKTVSQARRELQREETARAEPETWTMFKVVESITDFVERLCEQAPSEFRPVIAKRMRELAGEVERGDR